MKREVSEIHQISPGIPEPTFATAKEQKKEAEEEKPQIIAPAPSKKRPAAAKLASLEKKAKVEAQKPSTRTTRAALK